MITLLLPFTLVSLVLGFTQMTLAVQKHLEMGIIIILNNPERPLQMQIFQNSLSGEVLALALHLGVFGAGPHPDGPGRPENP